jgi:hypothetical protein
MPASTARPRRIAIALLFACVGPAFGAFGIALLFVAMSSGAALSTPNFAQVLIWLGYLYGAAPAAITGVLYGFASPALQRVWLSPLYGGAVTFMLSSVWHTSADAVVLLSLAGAYAAHLGALAVRLLGWDHLGVHGRMRDAV